MTSIGIGISSDIAVGGCGSADDPRHTARAPDGPNATTPAIARGSPEAISLWPSTAHGAPFGPRLTKVMSWVSRRFECSGFACRGALLARGEAVDEHIAELFGMEPEAA